MKILLSVFAAVVGFSTISIGQTANEDFMSSKIKTNTAGDFNMWVHGENDFSTVTTDNWNNWKFSSMGLEGSIETQNVNDFTSWIIPNVNITLTNANGNYNSWIILGEDYAVSMTTSNWNTWAITGALNSGISTTDTDNYTEWEIQGGDWSGFSPSYRTAALFISVVSSSILKNM